VGDGRRPAHPALVAAIKAAVEARGWNGRLVAGELRFRCPAHDDATPSAGWHPEKHAWYCHVCKKGGGAVDLARRLGIPLPDASAVVATFTYRDAAGQVAYHVDRIEPGFNGRPKDYLPRRPHTAPGGGSGGWKGVYGLRDHGIDQILYALDALPPAGSGATVLVPEGEKKVDLLRRWGFHATCNTGGAKKWRRAYSERLRGLHVVILPDNDQAGRGRG